MKICPNCNESNTDTAIECVKCQTKFPTQSSSNFIIVIVGGIIAVVGLVLIIYGDSQNRDLVSQLGSLFGSGQRNPGTPWMIAGAVTLGIGVIMVLKKLFFDKK
jgi:hypothetical protein